MRKTGPLENTDPEFETDKERADYYQRLAEEYAAKLNALRHVLDGDYRLVQGDDGHFYSEPKPKG